jgi:short-subunit dehydrogenase
MLRGQKNKCLNWDSPGTAFTTRASSGMGLSFAKQLALQGFNVVLLARR